jgi:tRNA pseudouridine38-40 synthase
MRNIKITIEYDGTNYAGWQRQKAKGKRQKAKVKTIQETIEKVLEKILNEKIRLIAQGRTDAGVHAEGQVANFKTESSIPLGKLQLALNSLLPDDIVISKIEAVALRFNSRFDTKSKVYRYTILNRPYPCALLRKQTHFYPYPLDVRLMREEARILMGKHNFKSFQAKDKKERGAIRTIKRLKINRNKDLVYIDIEADGFLYNMARNIIGTLIEIGRGKFSAGSLKKILRSKNRKLAGPTAPARGLCLLEVKY